MTSSYIPCKATSPSGQVCNLDLGHQGWHKTIRNGRFEASWNDDGKSQIPESPVDDPIAPPKDISEHERVLARAIDIVDSHDREHGELWREADATELGAMARHKANRVNYAARRYQDSKGKDMVAKERIVESALDGINYLVFIIRHVEDNDG